MSLVQITFSVLVFPSEHHAVAFSVAAAATGSCVLKLGVGWLMGEPGEIFKILDDPLGDRCHASRCDEISSTFLRPSLRRTKARFSEIDGL